jgi:hypothetical protein
MKVVKVVIGVPLPIVRILSVTVFVSLMNEKVNLYDCENALRLFRFTTFIR